MELELIPIPIVVVVIIASALAALTDIWRFKVYNVLTFPVLFSGLAYYAANEGWSGLAVSALGAAFGLAVFVVPYLMGGMGAGDVKFVAALGAWLGIQSLAVVVFFGCMATGLYALFLVYLTGGVRQLWFNLQLTIFRFATVGRLLVVDDQIERVQDWTKVPDRRRRLIPFSAMIAVGVILTIALSYSSSK